MSGRSQVMMNAPKVRWRSLPARIGSLQRMAGTSPRDRVGSRDGSRPVDREPAVDQGQRNPPVGREAPSGGGTPFQRRIARQCRCARQGLVGATWGAINEPVRSAAWLRLGDIRDRHGIAVDRTCPMPRQSFCRVFINAGSTTVLNSVGINVWSCGSARRSGHFLSSSIRRRASSVFWLTRWVR